jgi:RNA polymerase sigma-70 factor (ECF subfamily)
VHRATAARWLEKARDALEQGTRALLVARLGIGDSSIDSLVAMVRSELHVSLASR